MKSGPSGKKNASRKVAKNAKKKATTTDCLAPRTMVFLLRGRQGRGGAGREQKSGHPLKRNDRSVKWS